MNHKELLKEMKNIPSIERNGIIFSLLDDGDISYVDLSRMYVYLLNKKDIENRDDRAELASCLYMETTFQRGNKNKGIMKELKTLVHRSIAILDYVGVFSLGKMKEEHSYDEKLGRSQGIFWNNKE